MADLLVSAFSPCLLAPEGEEPPPPEANKNWNPGNYIASPTTNNDSVWGAMTSRLNNTNDPQGHWKGVMIRLTWLQLEGATLGDYTGGFNKVQQYLDQIAAFPGKKLIVFIQTKSFGKDPITQIPTPAVPLYMRNSATYADPDGRGNGQYTYTSVNGGPGGAMPSMHVNSVRDRMTALMTAFGNRFNNNPNLEAIVFAEAALGTPLVAPGTFSKADWSDGMVESFVAMRLALSNIQICQWINDRQVSEVLVPGAKAAGVGFGMTDLCPNEAGFNIRNDGPGQGSQKPGNIQLCQESNGLAIIIGHCSAPAMHGSVAGRCQAAGTTQGVAYPAYPGPALTRQAMRDFAVNTVGVTHLLWLHVTSNHPAAGSFDAAVPASCQDTDAPFTFISDAATGGYNGKSTNLATDNWVHAPGSNITTVTTRPAGWT